MTVSTTRFVSVFAMAALLWVGCATPNPLKGWRVRLDYQHFSRGLLDAAITEDFKSYIETLSREERINVFDTDTRFLEDGTGKHAIQVSIPLRGFWSAVWWDHILVYDANNKRIETMKYKSGHSIR